MLARELYVKNMKKQREFIKTQLTAPREDGNPSYSYTGHLYPEVKQYFIKEGFEVYEVHNERLAARTNGLPVFIFSSFNGRELSKEELEEAEAYNLKSEIEMTLESFAKLCKEKGID